MTRRGASLVAVVIAVATLMGCSARTLHIGYPERDVNRALLASIPPQRIVVAPVTDRRPEKTRIGVRPKDGEPLVTARPVTDIVRDALVIELGKNGHDVVTGPGEVVIAADVEEFWLDAVGRSSSTQYVGRVVLAVAIADGRTTSGLLRRRYVGISRRTGEPGAKETWRDVMDTALARTMHDLATDPEIVSSMARASR